MSLPSPVKKAKKEVKGVDYFTQSFDINMDTWIDLKTIVYHGKKLDPTYTQRKVLAIAIQAFKEKILASNVPLDVPEELLEEAKRRAELIKEGKKQRLRKSAQDDSSQSRYSKPNHSVFFG